MLSSSIMADLAAYNHIQRKYEDKNKYIRLKLSVRLLHGLIHLMFMTSLGDRFYYQPYFILSQIRNLGLWKLMKMVNTT